MGFRNRISVFISWCWNYLTFDRASRLLRYREVVEQKVEVVAERRDDPVSGG